MNKEQIIKDLQYLKLAIEWDNPLDYQTMITNAITYIENSAEQKHGHFVQNEFISTLGMCSVCEHPIDDGDNFCKWCGAKMDGDSE